MSGRIVVGVDGSATGDAALDWAAGEALVREAALEVVHAEWARRVFLDGYRGLERAEEELLERSVRRARSVAPGITVSGTLYDPPAAPALLRAARGADLLVVGSRGGGPVREVTMGSVSNECVHRASCPVVIVPIEREVAHSEHRAGQGVRARQAEENPGG